jgi:hypothetical protein
MLFILVPNAISPPFPTPSKKETGRNLSHKTLPPRYLSVRDSKVPHLTTVFPKINN